MPTRQNYPKLIGEAQVTLKPRLCAGLSFHQGLVNEQSFVDSAHLSLRTLFSGIRYNFDKLEVPLSPTVPATAQSANCAWFSEVGLHQSCQWQAFHKATLFNKGICQHWLLQSCNLLLIHSAKCLPFAFRLLWLGLWNKYPLCLQYACNKINLWD